MTRVGAVLCLSLVACGTVVEYRHEAEFLADGDRSVTAAGPNDCDAANGYRMDSYVVDQIAAPELHIVGVYAAPSVPGTSFGEIEIDVRRPGPSTLVLTAYERTVWTVRPALDAVVDRVIATGYWQQEVIAPDVPEIEVIDWVGSGDMLGLGFMWPSEADRDGDCSDFFAPAQCDRYGFTWKRELENWIEEVGRLVDRAEEKTGRPLSTFHGCPKMSAFVLAATTARTE